MSFVAINPPPLLPDAPKQGGFMARGKKAQNLVQNVKDFQLAKKFRRFAAKILYLTRGGNWRGETGRFRLMLYGWDDRFSEWDDLTISSKKL